MIQAMDMTLILLTILLTVGSNIYYIVTVFRGKTKPHIYSWLIWAIINISASLIQREHGAGWWALTLGLGGCICIIVALISLRYGEKHITRFDTVAFLVALGTIPLWLWAKQDLLAMILAMSIDALSFFPTMRKSYHKPHEENTLPYYASGVSFFMSIFLTQEKSLINILYPSVICGVNFAFIGYIYLRRRKII